jgi:hypothetical protein
MTQVLFMANGRIQSIRHTLSRHLATSLEESRPDSHLVPPMWALGGGRKLLGRGFRLGQEQHQPESPRQHQQDR